MEGMTAEPEIRTRPGAAYPPGPGMLGRVMTGRAFRQNPIEFLTETARRYGDLVHYRSFEGHVYQFNHPALIQELMVDNERRNRRAAVMQRARQLLGEGLLTSEEPLHNAAAADGGAGLPSSADRGVWRGDFAVCGGGDGPVAGGAARGTSGDAVGGAADCGQVPVRYRFRGGGAGDRGGR